MDCVCCYNHAMVISQVLVMPILEGKGEGERMLWYFIQKRHSNIVCKISGSRRLSEVSGKGLEVQRERECYGTSFKSITATLSARSADVDVYLK